MDTNKWLKSVVDAWSTQIDACQKAKWREFGETAHKAWTFMGKADAVIMRDLGDEMPEEKTQPQKVRINKVREFVSLMMPHIHEEVLHRTVKPRIPELPEALRLISPNSGPKENDYIAAWEMEHFLNYLPGEYGLYRESRMAIQEALVKGRGIVWHEMVDGPYGPIPASNYDTVDGLLVDPDAAHLRDANYTIRRRIRSCIAVAEEFDIPLDQIRKAASAESHLQRAFNERQYGSMLDDKSDKFDVCIYYEVWSRIGMGHKLKDAPAELKELSSAMDDTGQHIWLAILPGLEYPLNLPPHKLNSQEGEAELQAAIEWPIAFFEEPSNPWAFSVLDFHPNSDNAWATSPLEAGLPLQYFLDRVYTFVMRSLGNTARRLHFVAQEFNERVKDAITNGKHDEVIPVDKESLELAKLAFTYDLPDLSEDVWKSLAAAEKKFEESTGMMPLLYGGEPERQDRSAFASRSRETHMMNRPNDMAKAVRDWNSRIAAKEAQCARLYVSPSTVAPLFGEPDPSDDVAEFMTQSPLTYLWATLVNTDEPAIAAAEMQHTCESGAGSRANRQEQAAEVQMLVQTFGPVYAQWATSGIVQPYNQLMEMLGDIGILPMKKLMIPEPQVAQLMQMQTAQQANQASPEYGGAEQI